MDTRWYFSDIEVGRLGASNTHQKCSVVIRLVGKIGSRKEHSAWDVYIWNGLP